MQIMQSKQNIVEKILRDKGGRLVRAKFAIYEIGGKIKARLIDVVYIESLDTPPLTLSGINFENKTYLETKVLKSYVSPFVNLEALLSSSSKPRAPTF
ncbi:MAG: hypothetical protein WAX37_00255 [Minisyncoccia bacterium]